MAGRMAGGHASVNDIRASIQALRGFGEGQDPAAHVSTQDAVGHGCLLSLVEPADQRRQE